MTPEITKMLMQEKQPANIQGLLQDLKKRLAFSREKMKSQYAKWDRNLRIFRGIRIPDEQDLEAINNDEPGKQTIPLSFTQVMTFVTFSYLLLRQNSSFFELESDKNEEYGLAEVSEDLLSRDLRKNIWAQQLFQALLDLSRFGMCAFKTVWQKEFQFVNVELPATSTGAGLFNVMGAPETIRKEVLKYEGNKIIGVSPFRLLPDLRMPLTRWREGRFVADEYEYHIEYLRDLERKGIVAGTEFIDRMDRRAFEESNRESGRFAYVEESFAPGKGAANRDEGDFMSLSTEGHFKLNPSKYELSDEDYDCDYIIGWANDQRIIRIERMDYVHNEFIYDIGQFIPDVHLKLNAALSDTVHALQDVVTWLINSRIVSVRQGLERHMIVDPQWVDTVGLEARSPILYKKKGSPMLPMENFIHQLDYKDGTTTHFAEADQLTKVMQTVTGVNENAMGQYAPGRRSATENRAANAGASSRMLLHVSLLWEECLAPLGKKMLSNLRQGLSIESFVRVIGMTPPSGTATTEQLYAAFCPPLEQLVGSEDFFVFNGTTQSERNYLAQSLQDLVSTIMSNPEIMPMLGYDVNKLIDEIQFLRGVQNVNRFKSIVPAVAQPNLPPPVATNGAVQPGANGAEAAGNGAERPQQISPLSAVFQRA